MPSRDHTKAQRRHTGTNCHSIRRGQEEQRVDALMPVRGHSLAVAILAWSLATTALANPTGGVVSGGAATIGTVGATTTVTQTTNRAVIDWSGFDIGVGETTEFVQPSSSAIALNRIGGGSPSQILGTLTANGNLILVNPNGVVFGSGSQVDANSLVATTANISDANFMGGIDVFDQPGSPTATIENRGTITAASAGLVGLVAPNVINSGTITANLGKVHLASGDTFTLDLYGDGLMNVAVSNAVGSQLIDHSGVINAGGGQVKLTAAAGSAVVNSLITVSGEIHTPAVGVNHGVIEIFAEGSNATAHPVPGRTGHSTVIVSGYLNATNDHGNGGRITVTADHVGIASVGVLDASGTTGGGVIAIGGDLHGGLPANASAIELATLAAVAAQLGPTPTANALYTIIQSGAIIKANATQSGHGGLVSVWADDRTEFGGYIEANGGLNGGDGGMVETSGYKTLIITGTVEALADGGDNTPIDPVTRTARTRGANRAARAARTIYGKGGEWLLDPADITITGATANSTSAGVNPITFTATATGSTISAATINAQLQAGTSVIIQTSADGFAGNGDIIVNSAIVGTGGIAGGNLTLSAYRNITVNASITLNNGDLTLQANNAGAANGSTGVGSIYVGAAITTNGGDITMGGGSGVITAGSGYAVGHTGGTSFGGNTTYGIGIFSSVNAGGGNVIMNGRGAAVTTDYNYGIYSGAATSTSGAGTITVSGLGGGSANSNSNFNYGIGAVGGTFSTVNGLLTINGTGGSTGTGTGSYNHGVYFDWGGASTSGTGSIVVNATGGTTSGGYSNKGLTLDRNSTIQTTSSGNITLNGTGGSGTLGYHAGVELSWRGGDAVNAAGGAIAITGTGGTSTGVGSFNTGVVISNSSISNTGAGTVSIVGTGGGNTGHNNYGVTIGWGSTSITTATGALTIQGTAGSASGNTNAGIFIDGGNNNGNTTIGSSGGAMTITGTGGTGAGQQNYGIYMTSGATSAATIGTTGSGTLTVTGTGGGGSGASVGQHMGVYVSGGGAAASFSTVNGQLSVTGTGGGLAGGGTWGSSHGVYLTGTGAAIKTTGTGNLTVMGTGGNGTASGTNHGVYTATGGLITTSGGGDVLIKGVKGQATSYGIYNGAANTMTTTNGGDMTLLTDTIFLNAANNVNVSGTLTVAPYTNIGTSVGTSVGGTLNLSNTYLGYLTANDFVFGSTTIASGAANNSTVTVNSSYSFTKATVFRSGGTLTLAGAITSSASGNALTFAATDAFNNTSGSATPITLTGGGRWLVYSKNAASNSYGGMTPGLVRYNCTYNGAGACVSGAVTIPAAGNGFLYSDAAGALTVTATVQNITYGNNATLVGYSYTITGYGTGEAAMDTVTGSLTGTSTYTAGSNVGTYNLDYSSGTLSSAMGYTFTYANNAGGIVVGQRSITIDANNQTQTYGAGNSLTAGYTVTSGTVYAGDSISSVNYATNATSSTSGNWNATNGTPWTITASGATGTGGFNTTNYAITYTTGDLTINQKTLTVTSSGGGKTYDGTDAVGGTFALANDRIAGDVVTQTGTSAFTNVNAGARTIGTTGISIAGADSANYTLAATTASSAATIAQRSITITAGNQTQTYGDGNSFTGGATLTAGTLAAGDTFTGQTLSTNATSSTSGNWNAGAWNINASAASGTGGFGSTNYAITYVAGNLTINQKTLTVSSSGGDKTYDGTNAVGATFALANDAIAGDLVTQTGTSIYTNVNAGARTIATSGISIAGADSANYTLASASASSAATITAAASTGGGGSFSIFDLPDTVRKTMQLPVLLGSPPLPVSVNDSLYSIDLASLNSGSDFDYTSLFDDRDRDTQERLAGLYILPTLAAKAKITTAALHTHAPSLTPHA